MSVPGSDRVRLDSWKEIAEYLGRDVRTVVRWEKEKGLPVHTVPGLRRRSVFAYADELDSWLAGTPQVNGEADAFESPDSDAFSAEAGGGAQARYPGRWLQTLPDAGQAAQKHSGSKLLLRPKWLLTLACVTLIVLLGLVYFVSTNAKSTVASSVVDKVTLQENKLQAWNRSGGPAWSYSFPTGSPQFHSADIYPHIGEIAGEEIVVTLTRQPDNPETYMLFSQAGRLLWQFSPQEVLTFGKETFSPPWVLRALHHLNFAGDKRTALSLSHHTWWPCVLVLLDEEGRTVGKFVNSGWIKSVDSFDSPSGLRLVAGGASNAHNGGMIAILDANHLAGSSPEKVGSAYECKNCGTGRPLKYFVFPRSEINIITRSTFNFATGTPPRGSRLIVQTLEEESKNVEMLATAIYEFSLDLQLLRASYGHRYWDLHRQLEIEGRIMHSKAECPDRNGPRSVLSWDPQNGWKELHPN